MSSNEEIINYVMSTPENTNPNVLRGMLKNGGGGSGGDYKSIELLRWTEFGEWTKKSQSETGEQTWECSLGTVPVDELESIDIIFRGAGIVGEIFGLVRKDFVWVDYESPQIDFPYKLSDLWHFRLIFEEVDETLEVKLQAYTNESQATCPDLEAVILYIIRPVDGSEESEESEENMT